MVRMARVVSVGMMLCGVVAGVRAQQVVSATEVLEHPREGQPPLVVWMVTQATPADALRYARLKQAAKPVVPLTSEERTLGEFGQTAGTYGQTSGSYGQTSGSYGKPASETGQTAGSYGTSAGGLGQTAGSYGQTAGSAGTDVGRFGQTAGSYGQTAGSYGQSSNAPLKSEPIRTSQPVKTAGSRNALHEDLAMEQRRALPDARVQFVDVNTAELEDRLRERQGTADYPDVVVGNVLPDWWDESGVGLTMLGRPSFLDDDQRSRENTKETVHYAVVMKQAPHPEEARAFVVWMRGGGLCLDCRKEWTPNEKALGKIAMAAYESMLTGGGLANRDSEAAEFNTELAWQLALNASGTGALDGITYRFEVADVKAGEAMAVVSMRAIAWSPRAFGVLNGVAVLRRVNGGAWKVLQLTPNGWPWVMSATEGQLASSTHGSADGVKVVGIAQAAPADGDHRQIQPDLWWDNPGSVRLLVVEWQLKFGTGWTSARVMPIVDRNPRVQTRVTATFARMQGLYRWRVWAVGQGGVMTLSPWKTVNVEGH